jgi:hypothetical protein
LLKENKKNENIPADLISPRALSPLFSLAVLRWPAFFSSRSHPRGGKSSLPPLRKKIVSPSRSISRISPTHAFSLDLIFFTVIFPSASP